jgi:hypothetical protein
MRGLKMGDVVTVLNGKNEEGRQHDETERINELQKAEYMPSLRTVLMVEKAIHEAKEWPNKRQLWLSLPKRIMYQKLLIILDYLEYSHKIVVAKTGEIVWVWDPGFSNRRKSNKLKTF